MGEISSQGTKFSVQSGPLGAAILLNAGTKTKPTTVTATATPSGIVVGDFVIPKLTGWKSIDDRPLLVSVVAAMVVTLADTDSTNEASTFPPTGATLAEVSWAEICMATLTFTTPAGAVIDTTTLCDLARTTVPGMPGIATWNATGFWDSQDVNQKILRDLLRSGSNVAMKAIWRDGSGIAFIGNVNTLDIRAGVDQAVAITVGGNVSGMFTYVDYSAGGTPFMVEGEAVVQATGEPTVPSIPDGGPQAAPAPAE